MTYSASTLPHSNGVNHHDRHHDRFTRDPHRPSQRHLSQGNTAKAMMTTAIPAERLCKKCGVVQPTTEFHRGPPSRACKSCRKIEAAADYLVNRETILARNTAWEARNKDLRKKQNRAHRLLNKDKEKRRLAARYAANREFYQIRNAQKYAADPQGCMKASYSSHKRRLASDPAYKLRHRLANRIGRALKGKKDGRRTQELVGYRISELKTHLERQFLPWMTWSNHGTSWEIDHIRPVASFDFTDTEQVRACWALSNLRPLKTAANRAKGSKRDLLI